MENRQYKKSLDKVALNTSSSFNAFQATIRLSKRIKLNITTIFFYSDADNIDVFENFQSDINLKSQSMATHIQ